MRKWLITCSALTVMIATPALADADTFDLHWFWEQRCEDCHGHAGAFARRVLGVEDGELLGRHHRDDLMLFLQNHGVPVSRVKPLYDMLLAQAVVDPRFKDKCGGCHENAAGLARESVLLRDGVLFGRESGRPVAEYLKRHGKLRQDEVPFFVELLSRIEQEVHSPY